MIHTLETADSTTQSLPTLGKARFTLQQISPALLAQLAVTTRSGQGPSQVQDLDCTAAQCQERRMYAVGQGTSIWDPVKNSGLPPGFIHDTKNRKLVAQRLMLDINDLVSNLYL